MGRSREKVADALPGSWRYRIEPMPPTSRVRNGKRATAQPSFGLVSRTACPDAVQQPAVTFFISTRRPCRGPPWLSNHVSHRNAHDKYGSQAVADARAPAVAGSPQLPARTRPDTDLRRAWSPSGAREQRSARDMVGSSAAPGADGRADRRGGDGGDAGRRQRATRPQCQPCAMRRGLRLAWESSGVWGPRRPARPTGSTPTTSPAGSGLCTVC